MSEGYLGRGGRLTGGPAPELVASGYLQEIGHAPRLAAALSVADRAHAVALAEGGGVDRATARTLLDGLRQLDAVPPAEFPWDPALGDAFNSREAELRRRVGAAAAGWLSAGRPRREAFRVALRRVARNGTRALHDELVDAAAALARAAEGTAGLLAADYTYLQPAQPTTVGHLLLAYAYPLLRDAERLRHVHATLDLSVAGVGGSAGSRWPLDRDRLAALLGCSGLVLHAKDAMWHADVYVELAAAVATSATHLSQLAQDLEILASQEFAVVSLADAHSRASALMPQKRNPYALAVIRTMAGTAAGELAAMLVALHTGSARTDHFHLLNGSVPRLLDEAVATTRLAGRVVAGMRVDTDRLAEAARRGFTAAADVTDVVAQECGLDYRTAHHVVGRAVRELVDAGRPPDALTPELLRDAARAAADVDLVIDPGLLARALDPAESALTRLQRGGSSPVAMREMLADQRDELSAAREWSARAARRAREGDDRLEAAVAALLD